MQYLYSFANVSLILRVMDRLAHLSHLPTESLTIMYLVDRWVLRLNLSRPLPASLERDLIAFLKENGMPHTPSIQMLSAFQDLDKGITATQVMNSYQVIVVSHGDPDPLGLQDFCSRFVEGLGYYPPSLV